MFLDEMAATLHNSITRYPEALAYLRSREVTDEDIRKFRLGYGKVIRVPEDQSPERVRFLDEMGKGRKLENRIAFPITDSIGRVVGLAGRSIDSKDFKTFATEEAKLVGFFFGLSQALPYIYAENKVYVVEGYFDVIAFSKVFPNTVSTITSGMNDPQHDLLMMYCDEIVLCFDDDEPGRDGRDKALKYWGNDKRKRLYPMKIGYKDPAKALETLKLREFQRYVQARAKDAQAI